MGANVSSLTVKNKRLCSSNSQIHFNMTAHVRSCPVVFGLVKNIFFWMTDHSCSDMFSRSKFIFLTRPDTTERAQSCSDMFGWSTLINAKYRTCPKTFGCIAGYLFASINLCQHKPKQNAQLRPFKSIKFRKKNNKNIYNQNSSAMKSKTLIPSSHSFSSIQRFS